MSYTYQCIDPKSGETRLIFEENHVDASNQWFSQIDRTPLKRSIRGYVDVREDPAPILDVLTAAAHPSVRYTDNRDGLIRVHAEDSRTLDIDTLVRGLRDRASVYLDAEGQVCVEAEPLRADGFYEDIHPIEPPCNAHAHVWVEGRADVGPGHCHPELADHSPESVDHHVCINCGWQFIEEYWTEPGSMILERQRTVIEYLPPDAQPLT